MGQFLLTAGAKGKRYALPHATVLMHQPSGGIGGTATDIRIQAEQMLHVKKTLFERTAAHTGQPIGTIEKDADRDRWFTAEEAKEYGFIDHVVQQRPRGPVRERRLLRLRRHQSGTHGHNDPNRLRSERT